MEKKNPAVALGRRAGAKGGLARIDKPAVKQRSEKAVAARWSKNGKVNSAGPAVAKKSTPAGSTSDEVLITLLKRLRATADPAEIQRLSGQIERAVFHKQFRNA